MEPGERHERRGDQAEADRRGGSGAGPSSGKPRLEAESATFETSAGVNTVATFDAMGIKEDLLRGLYAYGFEKPSAIQQRAVLPIISGRDVIAQAQSGTGKTSMIALSLCQMVDVNTRECAPSLARHVRAAEASAEYKASCSAPRASWRCRRRRLCWRWAIT